LIRIRNDILFSNFGIVRLCRNEGNTETRLLEKYRFINALTMLDRRQIRSYICKTIQTIYPAGVIKPNRKAPLQLALSELIVNVVKLVAEKCSTPLSGPGKWSLSRI
jgi:hypothetical protein